MSAYETGWRSNKKSGEIAWTDAWAKGQNFQQLKGQGPVNASLDEEFSGLSKSGSDVDDDGAWVTLHQQDGKGATENAKSLASKWQAAGYDVRIQDLEGVEGTHQADIAIRKGSGKAPEPKVDTSQPASKTLTEAQSYVEAADDFRVSGGAVNQMAGDLGARDKFMENYKFNVKKRMEPGVAHKTGNDKLNATVPENVLGKPSDYATSRTQEREDLTDSFAQKKLKLSNIATDLVGKGAGFQSV